jgi:DNA-binding transcriptional LysR family regulator
MHFKGLDLNLLVVLDALLTEKNTTRAGECIFLGQSATSAALARLRDFYGDPLLVRSGQKMVLTPLAEELVEPLRQMLKLTEAIVHYNAAFRPETSTRKFRLNMGDEVATVLMPNVLKKVQQIAPGIDIEIHSEQGRVELKHDLAEFMERGDFDFLIVPRDLVSSHHSAEELFKDQFVCVVWSGNTRVHDTISVEEYFSLCHVVTRHGPQQTLDVVDEIVQPANRKIRAQVVVPTFGMKAIYLIGTDLVATMQQSLANYYATRLPLKILPLPVPHPLITMFVQWHRYLDHDPATAWFRNLIREVAAATICSPSEP